MLLGFNRSQFIILLGCSFYFAKAHPFFYHGCMRTWPAFSFSSQRLVSLRCHYSYIGSHNVASHKKLALSNSTQYATQYIMTALAIVSSSTYVCFLALLVIHGSASLCFLHATYSRRSQATRYAFFFVGAPSVARATAVSAGSCTGVCTQYATQHIMTALTTVSSSIFVLCSSIACHS